jgi:membrane protease YdiL (CAAX protease family)
VKAIFLVLLAVYVAIAVAVNRRTPHQPGGPTRISMLLQTPLFLLAIMLAWEYGAFGRQLVSPLMIGAGLVAGHLVFGMSLLITDRNLRDAANHFWNFHALWAFLTESPNLLFRFFGVSLAEEVIYRAAAQGVLIEFSGNPWLSIFAVAAVFSVVHWHFFRNPMAQSAEFLGFAVLLGAFYYWTGSLILVIVVHTMRNLEIVYLEYLVKLEELGDEQAALEAVETDYARLRREHT